MDNQNANKLDYEKIEINAFPIATSISNNIATIRR